MKKILIGMLLIWLFVIGFISFGLFGDMTSDRNNEHIVMINRLAYQIVTDFNAGVNVEKLAYIREEILSKESLVNFYVINTKDEASLVALNDIAPFSNTYIYKSIPKSPYIMVFELKNINHNNSNVYKKLIYAFVATLCFMIGCFLVLFNYVILPMKMVSQIPKELARGRLSTSVKQSRLGIYKDFIWGLDLLREVLSEEKLKNIQLEKERKTLVASLSHDVKTPLASIKNYTLALQDGIYNTPEKREGALSVILEKVNVIEVLNNELLDSSKIAFSNIKLLPKTVYLDDVVHNISTFINQRIELQDIEFKVLNQCENMQVWMDVNKMMEVVSNIIENAIKYGDQGSIDLEISKDVGHVIIGLFNSGKGVNEKEMKYIFSSFYRGSNAENNKGHGLGLFISKKIMQGMNGDIYGENIKDGFKINLVVSIDKD
jgi:signal transduction histidine kinase